MVDGTFSTYYKLVKQNYKRVKYFTKKLIYISTRFYVG